MPNATASSKPASIPRSSRDPVATRQRWVERLQRYQTAGLTIAQFCSAEGVSVPAFYQWKRQLQATQAAPNQPVTFVPVRVTHSSSTLEVVLTSGAIIRFGADCEAERVGAVLRAVGVIPC
jgi:transposase